MRNAKFTVAIALGFLGVISLLTGLNVNAQVSTSAVCQWTGPEDSTPRDWSSIAYWGCGLVPGPNDTAVISGYGRVVNVDSPVTVQNLSLLNNSTLNGFNTITVTGQMVWNGEVAGGAYLSPTGAVETVVIAPGGVVSLTNNSRMHHGQVVNYGAIELAAGACFAMLESAVFNNRPGGVMTVTSGEMSSCYAFTSPTGRLNNHGTLVKAGAGDFTLKADLTNDGQMLVLEDTLKVERANIQALTHTGSFSIAAAGILQFNSPGGDVFESASSVAGAGTFRLNNGADVTVRGAYQLTGLTDLAIAAYLNFDTPGGGVTLPRLNMGNTTRLRGSSDITITEVMTLTGSNALVEGSTGASNTLNIASGARLRVNGEGGLSSRTLNNYGIVEQASGVCFAMNNQAVFNNRPGGVYTVTLGAMANCYPFVPASGSFNNQGRLDKLGPYDFVIHYDIPVTNSGLINVYAGTFKPDGHFVQTAGETFLGNGSILSSQNFSLILEGGVLRGNGAIDLFQDRYLINNGATIAPSGLLTLDEHYLQSISGTLHIDIGGLTPGSEHDQFSVGRQATLNGRLILAPIGSFTPAAGDFFRVMTYGSHSGQFAEVERGVGPAFGPEYQLDGVIIAADPTVLASLTLSASPSTILADGTTTSLISATAQTIHGSPLSGQTITFTTNLGTLNLLTAVTNASGVASTTLSATTPGTATVVGTAAGGAFGQVEVAAAAPPGYNLYLPFVIKP